MDEAASATFSPLIAIATGRNPGLPHLSKIFYLFFEVDARKEMRQAFNGKGAGYGR